MRFEPIPSEDPGPDAEFGGPGEEDVTAEMLGLCDEFFGSAGPGVHAELRRFLHDRGYRGGWGLFIDILSFVAEARRVPGSEP